MISYYKSSLSTSEKSAIQMRDICINVIAFRLIFKFLESDCKLQCVSFCFSFNSYKCDRQSTIN